MNIFSLTTTVNIPHVLAAYKAAGKYVKFLVVGDKREPAELGAFCDEHKVRFLGAEEQATLGYKCSPLIGWGTIQRRNVGLLEALKSGAEIIHSWDDDNHPIDANYFHQILIAFRFRLGIEVVGKNRWHDPGQYLVPKSKHRGFPYQIKPEPSYGSTTAVKIGVVAGTCLADPDIDSVTRMALAPDVQQVAQIVESGYVINPYTWTVFNSQATAIRRELVPAWFMWTNAGRLDDIYASLLVQRVMRDRGFYVHCGKPFAVQNRNQHDLVVDLRAEIDGYSNVAALSSVLDAITLPGKSVLEDCRWIWDTLNHVEFINPKTVETAHAFLDDCEALL